MKKVFWNIVALVVIFFAADFFIFYLDAKKYVNFTGLNAYRLFYKEFYLRKPCIDFDYREPVNLSSNKKPILLFGCSFVYGHKISSDKIFSKVLADYTNRPVYNRAYHGFGVQHMLYQLEQKEFYNEIEQPEFIIYTFIGDHVRRMYLPSVISVKEYQDIWYKEKNSHLVVKKKNKFIPQFVSILCIKNWLYNNGFYLTSQKKKEEFLKQHLLQAKRYVDINWPSTKFIILKYLDTKAIDDIQSELESAGFIVIDRNTIAPFDDFDTRYSLSSVDSHPNEHAWEYIVPRLNQAVLEFQNQRKAD